MILLVAFVVHWQMSVFFQTFFLHRYGAHRMFTMSKPVERMFHLMTYLAQGASYLNPRGYAILHRMHHAFSDTPKDPHSPVHNPNPMKMMWETKKKYDAFTYRLVEPEARFDGGTPEWKIVDEMGSSWTARFVWMGLYAAFYWRFATHPWMWALFPMTCVMGPIHGAIVNWCGHKYGYTNFASSDNSKNTLVVDFLTAGELFQNNHHKFGMSPNFAVRWFEIDPTYLGMRVLAAMKLIDIRGAQKTHWSPSDRIAKGDDIAGGLAVEVAPAE